MIPGLEAIRLPRRSRSTRPARNIEVDRWIEYEDQKRRYEYKSGTKSAI